jgi:hypothetical protein
MLINEMGIEGDDNIVELNGRRQNANVDPKARVTMAMVLQAALTTNDVDVPAPPSRMERPVTHLALPAEGKKPGNGIQADVA